MRLRDFHDARNGTHSRRLSSSVRGQQQECDDVSPRAATTRAVLASAGAEMRSRLLATKPIQTVLIRWRLGGVGNGCPTEPRPSEIDAVAAEEAAKAATNPVCRGKDRGDVGGGG